ncbi:hypothetical protein OM076_18805 [Solirubrobacter ginsenosidimutans]|uniref:Toxin 37-like C-terminal domain-containing protein n=1 Tax=Solirubrobacter ginsenosidimutans TaxID=490573 RepID=A0A9X3S1G8_9ACTN|nr:hypothetical protein [Solirubrobacter ginsenosidimutans]MDA0162329.1 hypothetical protein [Solirubrobacter ginsenosidimutans]
MSRARSETGQTAAEYMGVLLVVSAILVALLHGGTPKLLSVNVGHAVDCIVGMGCPAAATDQGGDRPAPPGAPPAPPTTTTTAAAAAFPTPNPQPGPAPPRPAAAVPPGWTGQAANLPTGGDRPYVPPKNSHGKPKKVPAGGRGGAKGYEDADGNIWVWNPPGGRTAHGGPHWDVQHPDGSHTNVDPDGNITHGDDNFPNKSRGGSSDGGGNSGDHHTAEIVGGTAAGIGIGGIIWWGAKILSPACGPFAPVCAVVL